MALAVVVHPHPSMGGDSSHPFVTAVAARLAEVGVEVATPDLRDPDVSAAAASIADDAQYLIGYSWGAVVVSHASPAALKARVLVAPPASMNLGGAVSEAPVLVLVPEHDQYGDLEATRATFGERVEVIPDADHFLWGSIDAIADRVVAWVTSQA